MAFAIDPDLAPGAGLHAAALAELDKALARLHAAPVSESDIHDARKSCKKVRACLRLLRPELGERYATVNALLRDGARGLSARRDDAVAHATLLRLRRGRRVTAVQFQAIDAALKCLREPADPEHALADARRRLKSARAELLAVEPVLDVDTLQSRLAEQRSRCARGLRQARASGSAEDLHDWRKRVKYYGYQCALLAPVLPAVAAPIPALKALGETLGLHHDFHALCLRLERCTPAQLSEPLKLRARQIAQDRMEALARVALARGARLFEASGPP